MPVRARFGRIPRSAPSLTSTIVALAQQYQGQRDRNIEDAWKNGGEFEGKKVTDSTFQAHWKERLKGVSKDDPMYDYYNNLIHGYEFSIAESKMGQKYAEKGVSDGEMANFYRTWANKLPHDSEAYRHLMTQAAKFREAAGSRARGGQARAAAAAYSRAQNNTYAKEEAPYDVATGMIARYAVEAGYMDSKYLKDADYGWSKLTNAAGEDDPTNFAALLSDLVEDPKTSKAITAEIRKYDPNFSGTFNATTLGTLATNARNGAGIRLSRAQKAGAKGDATDARKAMGKYGLSATVIAVATGSRGHDSFVAQNTYMRARMDQVLDPSSGASPMEQQVAVQEYKDWLTGDGAKTLYASFPPGAFDPASPNFSDTAAGILGRANNTISALNGKATGQTLKDDLFGFNTDKAGTTSDAVVTAGRTNGLNVGLDTVANGEGIVVRVTSSSNDKPDASGTSWAIFSRNAPEVSGNDNLVPVVVPAHGTYTGGQGRTLGGEDGEVRYEVAVPMKVRVASYQDPATGEYGGYQKPIPGASEIVGKQVTITIGGVPTPIYGTYVGGRLAWSATNPFRADASSQVTHESDGTVVYNFTAGVPPQAAATTRVGTAVKAPTIPTQNPQDMIAHDGMNSPSTNPNFDPAKDKQTVWDSPMSALAMSSNAGMNYVAQLGDRAISRAETEWYTDQTHWTPDMNQRYNAALAAGSNSRAAFAGIVGAKSDELSITIKQHVQTGYGPEQPDQFRAALAKQNNDALAAQQGMTPQQADRYKNQLTEASARQSLADDLDKWGIKSERPVWGVNPQTGKPGMGGQGGGYISGLPANWTVNDLLNQPGMSLAQANDLAYRISKGAVGGPMAGVPGTPGPVQNLYPGPGGQTQYVNPATQYQNPYLPKAGSVGASYNADPSSIAGRAGGVAQPRKPGTGVTGQHTIMAFDKIIPPSIGQVKPQMVAQPTNDKFAGKEQMTVKPIAAAGAGRTTYKTKGGMIQS